MNVWTIRPRCAICRVEQRGQQYGHKFSCRWSRWHGRDILPRRKPGRSLTEPWLAKWPKDWRQRVIKQTTWHILPSHVTTHVSDRIAIFNDSDDPAHVELTSDGELLVKPLDIGRLLITYSLPEDESDF